MLNKLKLFSRFSRFNNFVAYKKSLPFPLQTLIGSTPISSYSAVIIFLLLSVLCFAQDDVKVKLNSSAGETRFVIQDSGDVTVAAINSDGFIYPGSSTINTARYISDDPTNYATRFSSNVYITGGVRFGTIVSTFTNLTSAITTSASTWGIVMPGMTGTLTVTAVPATIFVNFSCKGVRGTGGGARLLARILIDGTEVSMGDQVCPVDSADNRLSLALTGALRVTTPGTYTVAVEWQNAGWGTTTVDYRSLNAFWIGTP